MLKADNLTDFHRELISHMKYLGADMNQIYFVLMRMETAESQRKLENYLMKKR